MRALSSSRATLLRLVRWGAVAATFALACTGVASAALAGSSSVSLRSAERIDVVGSGPLRWGSVTVRRGPSFDAPPMAVLEQFRDDYHPRWVLALDATVARDDRPAWLRISLPGRPNGRTGWIPAASVDLRPVDRWLVVFRGSRTFSWIEAGRVVRRGRVAVGAPGMETPLGLFYVQSRFTPRRYPILGAYAFETSGYSKLSDWPGGGVVGVHGTSTPWSIGQAVSHGCVRLVNADVLFLRDRVRLGTPIKIVAA